MSRFLLLPGNNTLSHLAKCLALREVLAARGHEVSLAVSRARSGFLDRIGQPHHVLPDIQEADAGVAPAFSWFRPERVAATIRAEVDLIEHVQPDAVLGVFRFTGPLSARITRVPYDALICGSMTPACDEVLGFAPGEAGADAQQSALTFFRRACARRMAPALTALGLEAPDDAWQLLQGRRTFLWDFPEFQPLPATPGYHHVGPLAWNGWPQADASALDRLQGPIAYVAFGTGGVSARMLRHLLEALWHLGFAVALALGGQQAAGLRGPPEKLAVFEFLASGQVLPRAALVVCHGGQLLVFEAMRHLLPVFVLPLQPEQAQNGVCVERLGCGQRLLSGVVFQGDVQAAETAFLQRPASDLADEIAACLADAGLSGRLAHAAACLDRYPSTAALAMEET